MNAMTIVRFLKTKGKKTYKSTTTLLNCENQIILKTKLLVYVDTFFQKLFQTCMLEQFL